MKKAFLDVFPDGVINLHGGPLPHYHGGSPLNWQILRGECEIGISLLFSEEGVDTGPGLASERFPLGPDETIDEVVAKTLPLFSRMLLEVLDARRCGALRPVPQDAARARYFAKRLPEDGWIDWHACTAQQVHDLVRALSGSYRGAFTFHRGRKIVIERTRCIGETIIAPPGRVLARRAEGIEVARRRSSPRSRRSSAARSAASPPSCSLRQQHLRPHGHHVPPRGAGDARADVDFCNLTITSASTIDVGKRIAVAAMLAAAYTCE